MARKMLGLAPVLMLLLGACSNSWFGDPKKPPLPGERISVLQMQQRLEPDPAATAGPIELPLPTENESWPLAGGVPSHSNGHLALGSALRLAWSSSIGDGASSTERLTAAPVVAAGRVFTLDTTTQVSAYDAGSGRRLWRVSVIPRDERGADVLGGGIGYADGRLFVTAGYSEVLALDAENGGLIWRQKTNAPVRAAPTVLEGRVFTVTLDNETVAMSVADGSVLWTHSGLIELAGVLGAASPAADRNLVVSAYSSGEVFGLRIENGRIVWSDSLGAIRRTGAMTNLADVRGAPVIDRGLVFAVSYGGRVVGIDERTGARAWQQEVGGAEMPWVAGETLYLVTNDAELLALTRRSGQIRWVRPLDRWLDGKRRTGAIIWTGPVLAGGRLILANSVGEVWEVNAETGAILGNWKAGRAISIPPVVAGNTLYILNDSGELLAYR